MSFFKNKEYEIVSSMSEELILKELGEMKQKFVPVTKLTAKHFNLMVLAPSHQSGRRRSGGFVQLVGSVSSQGDESGCFWGKEIRGYCQRMKSSKPAIAFFCPGHWVYTEKIGSHTQFKEIYR